MGSSAVLAGSRSAGLFCWAPAGLGPGVRLRHAAMHKDREVSFAVNCADTRLGFHVRVVGSCQALGTWRPQSGLPLHTGPTEFPTWKSSGFTRLPQEEVIEYKYVICDNDGNPVRWEERSNRTIHLTTLVGRGVVPANGWISVVEAFNTPNEADELRFRSAANGPAVARTASTSMRFAASRQVSEDLQDQALLPGAGGIAPTIRERIPSMALLVAEGAMHSSSYSHLGPIPGVQVIPAISEQPPPETVGPSQGGEDGWHPEGLTTPVTSLVREESCSNLFVADLEDEEVEKKDPSEFEDRYALVGNGPLGEGTFGLVWRCTPKGQALSDANRGEERAAKIVRKARLQPRDMNYLLGEDGEVRTHLTMKHPHIVQLFEFFDEPHTVTLVLEYCRGGDLFDAIVKQSRETGRGFTEQQAAIATQHVLSALAYVHGQQVVHRDIKCENVLLAHKDVPVEHNIFKLCDFGFAAHDRGDGLMDRLGSPDTVAPEVVVGTRYSTPVDLWSAGVLVYMMLSATPPFYAPTDTEVLRKVRTGSYSLSGELWDSISFEPKNLIMSLMTVESSLRPSAAQALRCDWLKHLRPIPY